MAKLVAWRQLTAAARPKQPPKTGTSGAVSEEEAAPAEAAPLSEYEQERVANIRRNEAVLAELFESADSDPAPAPDAGGGAGGSPVQVAMQVEDDGE